GRDVSDFATGLRDALREDPDVLLVGEMRDLETISIALTAAETGHLVLSTLHTSDAAQAVHRIVDVFPAVQQGQVRQQLALAIHAIVCQQLVPRADGRGRVPAVEVLVANLAVRQHIRKERTENLHNEITLGKRAGMIALEESLARLVRSGTVALEEAQIRATYATELESLLRA
ncbi:MAG TPA: ATPase, T2SS/T4P/T4SS family, partial [Thermoanaerobaculaceae bacterium]|nr:ATPase, T2SS/T4P/T4SS family [Thermoanaerobaculaceae bacterium]